MSQAIRAQFPVGFGGFHVGVLWDGPGLCAPDSAPFVFVYDCGALNKQDASWWATEVGGDIEDARQRWCWGSSSKAFSIDLAVLSHTDFDHVCGIAALASRAKIGSLMLPRLSWEFRAAQAATLRRGTPRWYRRFLEDPAGWALGVGIQQVILVERGPSPEPEGPAADAPLPPEDDPTRNALRLVLPASAAAIPGGPSVIVSSGAPLTVARPGGPPSWRLVPVGLPPTDVKELDAALAKEVRGLSLGEVFEGLSKRKTPGVAALPLKRRLGAIYERHWKSDANRSSVMLLVQPTTGANGGWLCTGDANLNDEKLQEALKRAGGPLMSTVDAVHVPHHGSPHNLNAASIAAVAGMTGRGSLNWVCSSGPNKWKYPSASVLAALGGSVHTLLTSRQCGDVWCF